MGHIPAAGDLTGAWRALFFKQETQSSKVKATGTRDMWSLKTSVTVQTIQPSTCTDVVIRLSRNRKDIKIIQQIVAEGGKSAN